MDSESVPEGSWSMLDSPVEARACQGGEGAHLGSACPEALIPAYRSLSLARSVAGPLLPHPFH